MLSAEVYVVWKWSLGLSVSVDGLRARFTLFHQETGHRVQLPL